MSSIRPYAFVSIALSVSLSVALAAPLAAQIEASKGSRQPVPPRRVMLVGDSITQGGNHHASWRYPLYYALPSEPKVDFVGRRSTVFPDDSPENPDPFVYPLYYTDFDKDHEAYWGARTNAIESLIFRAALAERPDVVLLHIGTNDIGQLGSPGLANAQLWLPRIIEQVRAARPATTFLVAQIIPIGQGNTFFAMEDLVPQLNAIIADVVAAADRPASPVVLVDQYTNFDLSQHMQDGGLHPNFDGEILMAETWAEQLKTRLAPPRPPRHVGAALADGSFESLEIEDGATLERPQGTAWGFGSTPSTFRGFMNPADDTYLGAAGFGAPLGADGANVAYLYDAGSGEEEVALYQTLPTTCEVGRTYNVTVAIGNRLAGNPYGPSTYGGFRIELLAGNELLGSIADTVVPPAGEFVDAKLSVVVDELSTWLRGQALTVRLRLTAGAQGSATDFDHVRFDMTRLETNIVWPAGGSSGGQGG